MVADWAEDLAGRSPFWPIGLPWRATANTISHRVAEVHADLPADLVGQLSEVAARSGAALHHAVLATVFATLVSQLRVKTLRALASQRPSASEIARRLRPDDFHGIPRRPYVLVNFVADDAYTAATNPELPDTSVAPWTRA